MNRKAKPTRRQNEAKGNMPKRHQCGCGTVCHSAYALKQHRDTCNG